MMSKNTINYKSKLISMITNIPIDDLKKATYKSEELKANHKSDKIYRTDIIVTIDNNIICLEMNNSYYEGLINKNNSYSSKLRGEQLDSGDDYLNLKRVIEINIDNFTKYNGNKFIYEFQMREKDTHEVENDLLISYHIDLKYLKDKCYNDDEIEKYFRLFITDNIESLRGDSYMDEAIDELEKISRDKKIIGLYDAAKVDQMVLNTKLLDAENKGAKKSKIEIAKNLLKHNIDINIIASSTGLSIKEIKEIN